MWWFKELDIFLEKLAIPFEREVSLSRYTTIGIGGPARRVVFPQEKSTFLELLNFLSERAIPYFVLGGGSNILVSDRGYEGVVIAMKNLKGIEVLYRGEKLILQALSGTRIKELVRTAIQEGYEGFEFLVGVPATLGGAIRMNAGAFGKETSSIVNKIELWDKGRLREIDSSEAFWSYRAFKQEGIIISAVLNFSKVEPHRLRERVMELWKKRRSTQPLGEKSFGSTFKNPPGGFAGAMIEQVGLKGYKWGEAKISERHANFIVNTGKAKAEDVLALMKLARKRVYETFGIWLEPEVHFLGFDNGKPLDEI
ncbi:MAG: UDP-N-acetylmuramate dehydrogenase [Caldimicrobium sp.]|nr:UDP-N-acetylmuramate dehydrogenase [Caldimicrobium sp.]MCX7873500.1 UDP-N-acetylmuramate dehydrogenase [Caldimicrobium sp.]MDW8093826.1 UDP-N-acetylmuramate dehydrogenase [Caldimicrobium sp.]